MWFLLRTFHRYMHWHISPTTPIELNITEGIHEFYMFLAAWKIKIKLLNLNDTPTIWHNIILRFLIWALYMSTKCHYKFQGIRNYLLLQSDPQRRTMVGGFLAAYWLILWEDSTFLLHGVFIILIFVQMSRDIFSNERYNSCRMFFFLR